MITKERLEELIEQGATIWSEQFREKFLLKDFTNIDFYNGFVSCFYNNRELIINLNKVFETQEEAEWYKEFGCIERTERLELPTWEEDVRKDILFSASGGIRYVFMNKIKTGYSIDKENPYIIRIQKIGEYDNFIDYEYTKENYTIACRKAKELFLGEKK